MKKSHENFDQKHTVWLWGVRAGASQWEVVTSQVTGHVEKALDDNALDLAALLEGGAWWEAGAADGATGTAARGQNVLASWVNLGGRQLADVQVSWVLGIGSIAVVAVRNDWVEKVLEIFKLQLLPDNCQK